MKRFIQHEFLKVSHFTMSHWEHPVHTHNHFELVFIHKGSGTHSLSGMDYRYTPGMLFIISPSDYHTFTIEAPTEFTFLKFTNVYLSSIGNIPAQQHWNACIDDLLVHATEQQNGILTLPGDGEKVDALMRLIAAEWKATPDAMSETVFFLIQSILSIIRRNTRERPSAAAPQQGHKIADILHYIHQNIYHPARLQAEQLAETFFFSPNYMGIYFKEQTGITLRDYTNRYKLRLIENRLRHSSFTIKEISDELGFTDLSHFNKFFRQHTGMAPKLYRQQQHAAK